MTKKKTWARIKSTNRPGVFLVFVSEEAKMAHHQQYEKLLNRNKGARANVRC